MRLAPLFDGKALVLLTLHRADLIKTKCWALCDRAGSDTEDLLRLKPTRDELLEAMSWLKPLDENPEWPNWVERKIKRILEVQAKGIENGFST